MAQSPVSCDHIVSPRAHLWNCRAIRPDSSKLSTSTLQSKDKPSICRITFPERTTGPSHGKVEPTIAMCEKQVFYYRCGHERDYQWKTCDRPSLCDPSTANELDPEYVDGSCDTCERIQEEILRVREQEEPTPPKARIQEEIRPAREQAEATPPKGKGKRSGRSNHPCVVQ